MEDPNDPKKLELRKSQGDPIISYLIVRESLNMSVGKFAAQVAHAAEMLVLKRDKMLSDLTYYSRVLEQSEYAKILEHVCLFDKYLDASMRKVSLSANEREWAKIKELPEFKQFGVIVIDAGLTQLPPNTETVIRLWPILKSQVPKVIKRLQVLK